MRPRLGAALLALLAAVLLAAVMVVFAPSAPALAVGGEVSSARAVGVSVAMIAIGGALLWSGTIWVLRRGSRKRD